MTDQNIKADAGKPRLSLVPTEAVRAIAEVRESAPGWDCWGNEAPIIGGGGLDGKR